MGAKGCVVLVDRSNSSSDCASQLRQPCARDEVQTGANYERDASVMRHGLRQIFTVFLLVIADCSRNAWPRQLVP